MTSIPQLRKDINDLQEKLSKANARITELESRKPEVVIKEVNVPYRVTKVVEVPVEVEKRIEVVKEVAGPKQIEYRDNPDALKRIDDLKGTITALKKKIAQLESRKPDTIEVVKEKLIIDPETAASLKQAKARLTVANARIAELETAPPKIEYVDKVRAVRRVVVKEVPVEVIKEVQVEVIKKVPVEVIKEVPGPARIVYVERPVIEYVDNPELVEQIRKMRALINASNN